MQKYTFWSEEILAITAGQLQLFRYQQGATQEFMDFCVERINLYISQEKASVSFNAEKPNIQVMNLHRLPHEIVYYYDKHTMMYHANQSLLYKVLGHLEMAEVKIIEVLYPKKDWCYVDWEIRGKIKKIIKRSFEDTVRSVFG